jgi:hypothetical protein
MDARGIIALPEVRVDLSLQRRDLGQFQALLAIAGERRGWRYRRHRHPPPQHTLCQFQIPACLGRRHAPLGHELHRLELELAAELPSRHIHSPVPWSRSYLRVHETGSRTVSRKPGELHLAQIPRIRGNHHRFQGVNAIGQIGRNQHGITLSNYSWVLPARVPPASRCRNHSTVSNAPPAEASKQGLELGKVERHEPVPDDKQVKLYPSGRL